MYCERCGAKIDDGQRFCPSCGLELKQSAPEPVVSQMSQPGMKREYAQTVQAAPQMTQPGMKQEYAQQQAYIPQQQAYIPPQQAYEQQPQKKKSKLGLLIGLIAGGLALIAGVVVLLVLHPWSTDGNRKSDTVRRPRVTASAEADPDTTARPALSAAEETARPAQEPAPYVPAEEPAPAPAYVETHEITVWVGDDAVDLTKKQIENFNNTNQDGIKFVATVNPVSHAISANQMVIDISAGADLYCFAQDQLARLVYCGALSPLSYDAERIVRAANDAGSVAAATSDDKIYAYPMTSDNGYFMYYDKSVIPEEDVDSLEKLIKDCEKANKFFAFETNTSAWYIASWFFATGCVSEWITDGSNAYSFVGVIDTFNSPEGLIAVKGMKKLVDSKMHLSSSSAAEFACDAAIVVTGTWAYDEIKSLLGDKMGCTDLPSFTVDGKEYHLGSFNGCKLMGVKPQSDYQRSAALHKLAQYLTSEERQMERFKELSWGPSNLNAQKSDAVQANPGLAALLKQNAFSKPQGAIHGSWWDIAKVIADDVKAATDEAGLQAALDNYYNKINAIFGMTDAEKNAWSAIGGICGTMWDTDFPMYLAYNDVYMTDPLELHAGEEFKIRQGASWDVNYGKDGVAGGDNCVVDRDGWYYICFDAASGWIWLERLENY